MIIFLILSEILSLITIDLIFTSKLIKIKSLFSIQTFKCKSNLPACFLKISGS